MASALGVGWWRKKPVIVEAVQFDGSVKSGHAIVDWIWKEMGRFIGARYGMNGLEIATLETTPGEWFKVSKDDWIIRGVKGEFYPCKPDIFAATYEAIAMIESTPQVGP
jgi:hypothetical protein